jgi:hypothetical protein
LRTFDDDFDTDTELKQLKPSSRLPIIHDYAEIILDISGSTAFWPVDHSMQHFLVQANDWGKLKHIVVMGMYADECIMYIYTRRVGS